MKYVSVLMLLLIAAAAEFHTCSAFNVDPYQSGLFGQLKEAGKTPAGPAGRLDLLGQRQNLESRLFIEQDKQKRPELLRQQPERGKQSETLSGQQGDLRKVTERQQLERQKQTDQLQKQHGQAEQLQRHDEQAAQTQRHQQMLRQQGRAEQTHRKQKQTGQLRRQQGQAEQLRLQQQQGQQMRQQQQHLRQAPQPQQQQQTEKMKGRAQENIEGAKEIYVETYNGVHEPHKNPEKHRGKESLEGTEAKVAWWHLKR